jgi:hypothetical protein
MKRTGNKQNLVALSSEAFLSIVALAKVEAKDVGRFCRVSHINDDLLLLKVSKWHLIR